MAFHSPLDEFGSIPSVPQFCLPAAFAIPPVRILHYFSVVVHDCAYSSGGLALRYRFCTAMQNQMALRVTEDLVVELATREQVSLLDELIMVALCPSDQSLKQSLCLSPIVWGALEQQYPFMPFPLATS